MTTRAWEVLLQSLRLGEDDCLDLISALRDDCELVALRFEAVPVEAGDASPIHLPEEVGEVCQWHRFCPVRPWDNLKDPPREALLFAVLRPGNIEELLEVFDRPGVILGKTDRCADTGTLLRVKLQLKNRIGSRSKICVGAERTSTRGSLEKEFHSDMALEAVTFPLGFRAAGARCGLKEKGPDVSLLVADTPATAAARFTRNRFCSPAVQHDRDRFPNSDGIRAVAINSGNANTANGKKGFEDARTMVTLTAQLVGCEESEVLISSTGVIGQSLPIDRVKQGLTEAAGDLGRGSDGAFLDGIMTTDTVRKSATREIQLGQSRVRLGGVAKGAGMVHPNLATMLVYLTTDANITPAALDQCLGVAVHRTFNCLTVDGDTSTSDTVVMLASGQAGNKRLDSGSPELPGFQEALMSLCLDLVQQLARDGEGAEHFISVTCNSAFSLTDAHEVAEQIACSLLFKTAIFGRDPNWGRILMAIGNCRARYQPDDVRIWIGETLVFENLGRTNFEAANVASYLSNRDVSIRVDLGAGTFGDTVFTCDLTYDYVRINAEYHT